MNHPIHENIAPPAAPIKNSSDWVLGMQVCMYYMSMYFEYVCKLWLELWRLESAGKRCQKARSRLCRLAAAPAGSDASCAGGSERRKREKEPAHSSLVYEVSVFFICRVGPLVQVQYIHTFGAMCNARFFPAGTHTQTTAESPAGKPFWLLLALLDYEELCCCSQQHRRIVPVAA